MRAHGTLVKVGWSERNPRSVHELGSEGHALDSELTQWLEEAGKNNEELSFPIRGCKAIIAPSVYSVNDQRRINHNLSSSAFPDMQGMHTPGQRQLGHINASIL